jgi:single-stranded-DNA-specific exonuclease
MSTTRHWQIKNNNHIEAEFLAATKNDSLLSRILYNRGVLDHKMVAYYLNINSVKPSPPLEIPDMLLALRRIINALRNDEQIMIYGDYDVDGTSSVALLYRAFALLGKEVSYYVPDRHSEGYGLNSKAVEKFAHNGIKLLITCDCGISNFQEVELARQLNLDVIITDHHSIPAVPPNSIANCNPKTLPEDHPLHYLPGVGVAYKLAEALFNHEIKDLKQAKAYADSLLDLVALGIIADLAPLRSENRYLAIKGLKFLEKTTKPGLKKLLQISNVNQANSEAVGFGIAPRINAAGRLSDALKAVRLMITESLVEAEELAHELDRENKNRQDLCAKIYDQALEQIAANYDLNEAKVLVLGHQDWHHGVIGIVASRVLEKFHLPVYIMAIGNEIAKGSVRGIDIKDLDIFEDMNNIQSQSEIFLKYGGHKLAAGFSIKAENFKIFKDLLVTYYHKKFIDNQLEKIIKVDSSLFAFEISAELIYRLDKLSPYGIAHPQPNFAAGPFKVINKRFLGAERKHIKLTLRDELNTSTQDFEAIIWSRADEFSAENLSSICIVFNPQFNHFRNETRIQLIVKDWQCSKKSYESQVFDRVRENLSKVKIIKHAQMV